MLPWPFKLLQLLVAGAAVVRICGVRMDRRIAFGIAGVGVLCLFAEIPYWLKDHEDASHTWESGIAIREGTTPYTKVLNPPTSFPIMVVASLFPRSAFHLLWAVSCAVAMLSLIPLFLWTLRAGGAPRPEWQPPAHDVALLSMAMALSTVGFYLGSLGQSSFLEVVLLLAALGWADRRRWIPAGIALALASLKVGTLIGFLPLLLRKQDVRAWAVMAVAGLVFVLVTVAPSRISDRVRENLTLIRQLSREGQVNDVGLTGSESARMVTLGKVAYSLGVRNRAWVTGLEIAGSLGLVLWLSWMTRTSGWSRAAQTSLVALGSCLFLYHRTYDTVMLAVPLVYVVGRSSVAPPQARRWYRAVGLACIAIFSIPDRVQVKLLALAGSGRAIARPVEILAVPVMVWLVLAAMVFLALAEKRSPAEAPVPALAAAPAEA